MRRFAGQRCQISGYEHLEDVNVIKSNQIPLTDSSRSRGFGGNRGREEVERGQDPREEMANATECQRGDEKR